MDRGGSTTNWSNGGNWDDNFDIDKRSTLLFEGTNTLINVNNLPGGDSRFDQNSLWEVNGLTFRANAGAFTINGDPFISNGNITNLSSNLQTLNTAITVRNSQTWDGGSSGMTFNGMLTLRLSTLNLRNKVNVNRSSDLLSVTREAALNISNGARIAGRSAEIGYSNASIITVAGDGSAVVLSQDLTVGREGRGTLNISDKGRVSAAEGAIGKGLGYSEGLFGSGIVEVEGQGSSLVISGTLYLGDKGSGTLNIRNGGRVENGNGIIGFASRSPGAVNVSGAQSTWANSALIVGENADATLTISDGATVVARDHVSIGRHGILSLAGGILKAGTIGKSNGGQFSWTTGTLDMLGGDASLGQGVLESVLTLDAGKHLRVTHKLGVGTNFLLLTGGTVEAGTLTLGGGTVAGAPGYSIDMDLVGTLNGHGTVSARILNGAGKSISASGGALTLGQLGSSSGFSFGGELNVGSNQVLLLSAAKAALGSSTSIGDGGRVGTFNGADLAHGRTLSFTGNASIQGEFTNHGSVSRAGPAGTLTFHNDVTGAGSFAGDIVFRAGYSPGNSPAAVDFNGGDVTYDSNALLTMEILGNSPGTQYDQLVGINTLTFNGRLSVVFGNGFAPAAGRFQLFGFQSFAGALAPDRIDVTGFDRARLDFSHLGHDGTLSIAAVPEPGGYAMFAAGLGLMGFMVLRRQRRQAA